MSEMTRDQIAAVVEEANKKLDGDGDACDCESCVRASVADLLRALTAEMAESARLRARHAEAVGLLVLLKRGSCWCEVGIGNPMCGGQHSAKCQQVQAFLAAEPPR